MKYPYYPGCTLHEKAANFDRSARDVSRELGIELDELEEWQCCGAVYPLSSDGLFPMASPLRNLVRAEEIGDTMVTLCSACYNVHKRVDYLVKEDEEILERINSYNREDEYDRGVEVRHLIEVMRERGFDKIAGATSRDLSEITAAPYYGCLLLRPGEVLQFDDPESPKIFEELLESLGCQVADYPNKGECCGAYATVHMEKPPEAPIRSIVESARKRGADLLAVSCPLCHYNLKECQSNIAEREPGFNEIPVVYFTELMEYAFGLSDELSDLELRVK